MKNLFLSILLICSSFAALSGNPSEEKEKHRIITGKVTDVTGETIAGVKIHVNETGESFYADMDGNFKLLLPAGRTFTLSVHTIGYTPLKVNSATLTTFSDLSLIPLSHL